MMFRRRFLILVFLLVLSLGSIISFILFTAQLKLLSYLHVRTLETTNGISKTWRFENGEMLTRQNESDRIIEQLMHIPEDYKGYATPKKLILLPQGLSSWEQKKGSAVFDECPVNRCSLTGYKKSSRYADALLFKNAMVHFTHSRPSKQIWILYILESPLHSIKYHNTNIFNWTATYRHDSDIVTPYAKWAYYNPKITQKPQTKNYAANKTKKVAWFVSNCYTNNKRLEYADSLSDHISVDVYGVCGELVCKIQNFSRCYKLLENDYKFYLAFENSNCRDYITEKFYRNSLKHSVIPIVMGAKPEDYKRQAPENSYIHVDDFNSPKELAEYLHKVDKDDELYNSYFRWKGTGEFINTYFWCRLCAMLHTPFKEKYYENINKWWHSSNTCVSGKWKNQSESNLDLLLFTL